MRVPPFHKITQDVNFSTLHIGREFDRGDYSKDRAARCLDGRVERGRRIVVGNGNNVQPAFDGQLDELRGREFAVGRVGVRVQVNAARGAVGSRGIRLSWVRRRGLNRAVLPRAQTREVRVPRPRI